MTSRTLPGCLAREIVGLTELSRDALVDRWIAFYDKPPLRTRTKDLLVRAIAYEIQVEALGGLLATEKRALSAVADGTEAWSCIRAICAISCRAVMPSGTRNIGSLSRLVVTIDWSISCSSGT